MRYSKVVKVKCCVAADLSARTRCSKGTAVYAADSLLIYLVSIKEQKRFTLKVSVESNCIKYLVKMEVSNLSSCYCTRNLLQVAVRNLICA